MTRIARRGSFAWLVVHDLRLNWRRFVGMFGGASTGAAIGVVCVGALLLHALAWPVIPHLAGYLAGEETTPEVRVGLGAFLICVASWMAAQGLFQATRTLYDRGDLDLLLGSPLSPRKVLGAKAMAISLSSLGSVAMLALPVANVGAWRYGAHWLAFYPTLASLALAATALALLTTIALFYSFGPRRARTYAHLGGALIGGSFVLGVQLVALLPESMRDGLTRALSPEETGSGSLLSQIVWLPVEALLAEPLAMMTMAIVAIGLLGAAIWTLGDKFAMACLEAAGSPSAERRTGPRRVKPFRSGAARSLQRKEWRLLLRDPSLFAQLGLQIVYTIPLALVLVKSGSMPTALALTPAIIVIAAQVAASLAWLAVSGEDAPELIATAPVRPATVDAAKLSAIALPLLAIASVPLSGLYLASPRSAFVALVFSIGASVSTALLNLWHPMPGNRRGMLRRHAQSKVIGLMEHLLAILWAVGAVLALLGASIWFVPLLLAFGVLGQAGIRRGLAAIGRGVRGGAKKMAGHFTPAG